MLRKILAMVLFLPLAVFAAEFVEGKDYEVIQAKDQPALAKASVVEFFSYGCPWCFRIDNQVNDWVKQQGNKISFKRVPVIFHPEWLYYAKAYYVANLLGKSEQLNPVLFTAIQTDKKLLNSDQSMIDFFVANGVDKSTAESAFTQSTTLDLTLNEGNALMGRYRISGVPAFVVNNRYKTDLQMAQGVDRLFKVLDYLASKTD